MSVIVDLCVVPDAMFDDDDDNLYNSSNCSIQESVGYAQGCHGKFYPVRCKLVYNIRQ